MNQEEREDIQDKLDWEGFDYGIQNWFDDVEDKEFQRLRGKYLEVMQELKRYIYGD